MKNEISFMRQKDLFDPVNQRFKIVVFGAGSLGSFITLNLAKLGFNDIEVFDFDTVESHNIPNQFYKSSSIGEFKVEALKEIVKDFTDVEITTHNVKVDEKTEIPIGEVVYIITFDTLEARKLIYEKVKDFKCIVLDVRVGGEEYEINIVDTMKENELSAWKKRFDIEVTDLPCGARSIIYTVVNIASEVSNIVKKINNNENYPGRLLRTMKNYNILNNLNQKGGKTYE